VEWALKNIGEPAVDHLIQALRDENPRVRWGAAEALGKIGDRKAVPSLIQYLRVHNSKEAAKALGYIGDTRAVEPLIQILNKSRSETVIWALGEIGDARAVEPLIQALKDECSKVQEHIKSKRKFSSHSCLSELVRAVAKLGTPAIEPLVQALKDKDSCIRLGAAKTLKIIGWQPKNNTEKAHYLIGKQEWYKVMEVGEAAVEPLIQALNDETVFIRSKAANALREIGNTRAVDPLIKILKDDYFYIRDEAVWALVNIGEAAVEPLIQALNDGDWRVRWGAARALGEIKDKRAVVPLNQALKDENSEVRMVAAISIEKILKEERVESLEQALKDKIGIDEFERLEMIERRLNNYAQYRAYSEADYFENYQKFNPIKYDKIMQKIRDKTNVILWGH
jgi:HEAT repeat protein